LARLGVAGRGWAGRGKARFHIQGLAMLGLARLGRARPGKARQGKEFGRTINYQLIFTQNQHYTKQNENSNIL